MRDENLVRVRVSDAGAYPQRVRVFVVTSDGDELELRAKRVSVDLFDGGIIPTTVKLELPCIVEVDAGR